jgi:hypothetical protein
MADPSPDRVVDHQLLDLVVDLLASLVFGYPRSLFKKLVIRQP